MTAITYQTQVWLLECSISTFDNSTTRISSNLDNVLNTLSQNVQLHNGFYKATSGKNDEKIYGIVQCRADISPQDCANCTKMSIRSAHSCQQSTDVTITLSWCFLQYSFQNFFGVLGDPSLIGISFGSRFDDLNTVSKGIGLMTRLAETGPNQEWMVQTGTVDVGERGTRYGMVQCTKDMSRSDCGKCLDAQAKSFKRYNSTTIYVFGRGCRMWYNDYQFYSNISTTATNGGKRSSNENVGVVMGVTIGVLVLLSSL